MSKIIKIPGWELVRVIARGSRTTIFEGTHTILSDRRGAVKVLNNIEGSDDQIAFLQTVNTLARLQHPGIVPLYEIGVSDGMMYIAMALVEGGNLWEKVGHGRIWSAIDIVDFVQKLASALDYFHEQGVVHGALHPKHILLTGQNNPQLIGFGEYPPPPNETCGNQIHLAREQFGEAGHATAQSDIFAISETAFWMLAGMHPYDGAGIHELLGVKNAGPTMSLPEGPENLHLALNEVLKKGMAPKPDDRYRSAGAFAEAFAFAVFGQAYRKQPFQAVPMSADNQRPAKKWWRFWS